MVNGRRERNKIHTHTHISPSLVKTRFKNEYLNTPSLQKRGREKRRVVFVCFRMPFPSTSTKTTLGILIDIDKEFKIGFRDDVNRILIKKTTRFQTESLFRDVQYFKLYTKDMTIATED